MAHPKTMGACIDKLYQLREERRALEVAATAIKEKENELENHILDTFAKTELEGARGKLATAGVQTSTVPTVKDWDALYKYIKKNDAWDMLQKRVSPPAYRERLDADEVVPGVETYNVVKLSLKKR